MDDPDYAAKYDEPYGDDKIPRMAKQMVDARHVAGKRGEYIGMALQGDPLSIGGQLGMFGYSTPWLSQRIALAGLAGTGARDMYVGADAGLRAQLPSRLAPFVGVGTFVGYNERKVDASNDWIDNDTDGSVDEFGEKDKVYGFMAAAYPELGVHLWLNGHLRLTASGSYYITTDGRDTDFWFFNLQLGGLRY